MQLMQQLKRLLSIGARQGTSPQPISSSPIPRVTAADVARIVRRDFSADEYDTVMATLSEYGTGKWEPELARVRLAALKLADGSLQKLRAAIELAKCDFRDALTAAEYPSHWKRMSQSPKLSTQELKQVINSDSQQYEEWLKR